MKRTLYLSMVCLLSAFSAVGQTGLRGLNPIEKQKLQMPELPASQSRVTSSTPRMAQVARIR